MLDHRHDFGTNDCGKMFSRGGDEAAQHWVQRARDAQRDSGAGEELGRTRYVPIVTIIVAILVIPAALVGLAMRFLFN